MRALFLSLFILFSSITIGYAMDVGEKIPHDLSLQDQSGTVQSFDGLSGEKGIVLFFIRSVNWCPYCQAQLVEINKRVNNFEKQGYNVVALSYDPVGSLERFSNQRKITFSLLSDNKSVAIKAFGLLNTSIREGSPHYGIPNPTIMVIGQDMIIQSIHKEGGYKKRPDLDIVLRSLVYIDYDRRQNKKH